jgi:hypothetical protein
MASFQQTPGGTWRAQIDCRGARRSKTLATRGAAEAWAREMEDRIRAKQELELATANTLLATMVPKRMLSAIAAIPHSLQEVIRAAVPARTFVGIYFLLHNGEVVYVGQSVDMLTRIARHRREGREFDAYTYLTCDKADLDRLEAAYIAAFMPWMNHSLGRIATRPESLSPPPAC